MKARDRWVELLCRSLTPDERESVLGDLQECHATVHGVSWELLLLLLHRQASCWRRWRPWLVVFGVVMPTVTVISQIGRTISAFAVMQLWTRLYSGDWFNGALSRERSLVAVICICSVLAVEAWCAGFAIAALSPATLTINAFVVVLVWLIENSIWPLRSATSWYTVAASFALLVVPLILGVMSTRRRGVIRFRFVIVLAAFVSFGTALAIWTDGWFGNALERWSSGALPAAPLETRIWPFIIAGLPVFYVLLGRPRRDKESAY